MLEKPTIKEVKQKNKFTSWVSDLFNFRVGTTDNAKVVVNKDLPMIEVDKYTKVFGKFTSTENVTFKVGHGVIHGFIGPNGSGKTTTIKAMIGAYIPTSGELKINGNKAGTKEANSLVGYIPERASFPRHLNTINYLKAMGELSGLSPRASRLRAVEILKELHLEKQVRRKPGTFSSGMQKKILLAQSLLTDPVVLILDEPAANLDPTARKELFDKLIELRNQGKTIIISSHILSELERLIDEATFIYYGEVIFTGNIQTVLKGNSTVFIKSSDNTVLWHHLEDKGYKVDGDVKSEISVSIQNEEMQNALFKELEKAPVNINSYRANDLQSIYDILAKKAAKQNLGKQKIGTESTVKHVYKKTEAPERAKIFATREIRVAKRKEAAAKKAATKPAKVKVDKPKKIAKPKAPKVKVAKKKTSDKGGK